MTTTLCDMVTTMMLMMLMVMKMMMNFTNLDFSRLLAGRLVMSGRWSLDRCSVPTEKKEIVGSGRAVCSTFSSIVSTFPVCRKKRRQQ